jgi:hypothetical protein
MIQIKIIRHPKSGKTTSVLTIVVSLNLLQLFPGVFNVENMGIGNTCSLVGGVK